MSTITVKQAAGRLRELDKTLPGANSLAVFITASGGYGKAKQEALLHDLREVYAYVLGEKSGGWPFGDDVA